MSVSLATRKSFVAVKVLGSGLSVIGSSLVIYMVLRQKKASHSERPTYHRFLLAMSVYDLLQAAWQGLGAVPVPIWTGGYGSFGNTASCTALGFFVTLAMGGWVYNAALSIYYVMVIRYGVTESAIARRFEPITHVLAFVISMGLGISGLFLTVFNAITPTPEIGCFAWPYPDACYYDLATCERGRYYGQWGWAFYALQCLCVAIVIVGSAMLYATIRKQYLSSSRYASGESAQMRGRTRDVAWQAFWFALACFYANIWNILIIQAYSHGPHWWLMTVLFNGLFGYPAQGFFNFLIYVSPRYQRLRQRKPESGRLGALYEVVFVTQERDRRGSHSLGSSRRRSTRTSNSLQESAMAVKASSSAPQEEGKWSALLKYMSNLLPGFVNAGTRRHSLTKSGETFQSQHEGENKDGQPPFLDEILEEESETSPSHAVEVPVTSDVTIGDDASPAADATIAVKSDYRNELDLHDANEQDHD